MSDEKGRGRAKKLEKKVAKGQLNTFESYKECLRRGINGSTVLKVTGDPGRSQASFDIHSSELRDLLTSLLYDKGTIPKTFSLENRHFARHIVILHFTEWGMGEDDEPIPLSVLTAGRSECTSHSLRISKEPLHAVPLPSKLLCMGNSALNKFLGKSVSVPSPGGGTKRDRQGDALLEAGSPTGSDDSNDSLIYRIEKARLAMPAAFLRMWSYPLPISTLNHEREGHMRLHVPPEILGQSDPADRVYVTPSGSTSDTEGTRDSKRGIEGLVPSEEAATRLAYLSKTSCSWAALVAEERQRAAATATSTALASRFNIDVLVRNGIVKAQFACTVPKASGAYHCLFGAPPSDDTEAGRIVRLQTAGGGKLKAGGDMDEVEIPLSVCALDCEMCQTESGLSLTRLTVLSEAQAVVLDALVLPPEGITDYLTQYSGVSEDHLRAVSGKNGIPVNREGTMVLSMRQAQIAFLRLVSSETVVVGHSLDSDLTALRVVHERVVDTAHLYPHPRGFPLRNKLRTLAKDHLGIDIQRAGSGHDSCEDARAALHLTLRLLRQDRGVVQDVRHRTDTDKQEYYNREHRGHKAYRDPPVSILPPIPATVADYTVHTCLCYDMGSWGSSTAPSHNSGMTDNSSSNSSHGDAYGTFTINPCLGPNSELLTGSNTEQTLARAVGWLRRSHAKSSPVPDPSQFIPPPLRFCYTSLNFGGIESARKALLAIETAVTANCAGGDPHGDYLIMVIAQPALHPLYELRHQRRVVMNSSGTSTVIWNESMEERLKRAGAVANVAQVTFINGLTH